MPKPIARTLQKISLERLQECLGGQFKIDAARLLVELKLTPREFEGLCKFVTEFKDELDALFAVYSYGGYGAGAGNVTKARRVPFVTEEECDRWFSSDQPQRSLIRTKAPNAPKRLYLMKNSRNGLTKIGISTNPAARESTLQSEEPEIELIASVNGSLDDERALHHKYASKRVRGEWFNLTEWDVEEITQGWTSR